MPYLAFDLEQVEELMAHAEAATDWSMGYDLDDAKPEPALLLVKDEGIYLMSNGLPGLPRKDGQEGHHVVYAKGYDPTADDREHVWEAARAAVGGDDFVEVLPWIAAIRELRRREPDRRYLMIRVSRDTLELSTAAA